MQVSLQDAYREACLALGEAIVRERLLQVALAQAMNDQAQQASASADAETTQ